MRQVRPAKPRGLIWKTFLHTYAEQIWECNSLSVTDLLFWSHSAFYIIELHARRVSHVNVHTTPRCPTDAWTAQQLREAIAYGLGPKSLIRDKDDKHWMDFARVAHTSRIEMLNLHDGAAPGAPVFRSRGGAFGKVGRKLDPSQVTRIVEAAACRAGIAVYTETMIVEGKQVQRKLSRVSPHWLRHAHASHALDNGASIAV
jgi:integrase